MNDTTVTIEQTFQVLDTVSVSPPGSNVTQYVESGLTQLSTVTNILVIPFVTAKIRTPIPSDFSELIVRNIIDANPITFSPPELIAMSTTGFTVQFSAIADTTNYALSWGINIST